ncbi:DUF2964 family protein [Burkholderia multivorans]|uniref:DUF2964 family protein n=1 Tax=Burkholderia multivorans TaxID=87883 RepID=UPI003F57F469
MSIRPLIQINPPVPHHAIMTQDAGKAARRANASRRTATGVVRETAMIRNHYRIALATLSVFLAIASLVGIVHGMLFDERVFRYSIATLISSILSFVVLLNPAPGERP